MDGNWGLVRSDATGLTKKSRLRSLLHLLVVLLVSNNIIISPTPLNIIGTKMVVEVVEDTILITLILDLHRLVAHTSAIHTYTMSRRKVYTRDESGKTAFLFSQFDNPTLLP